MKRRGRKRPYKYDEVRRAPCVGCGKPSRFQWAVCADDNLYRPVCVDCDVRLNEMALAILNDPDAAAKMELYRRLVYAAGSDRCSEDRGDHGSGGGGAKTLETDGSDRTEAGCYPALHRQEDVE